MKPSFHVHGSSCYISWCKNHFSKENFLVSRYLLLLDPWWYLYQLCYIGMERSLYRFLFYFSLMTMFIISGLSLSLRFPSLSFWIIVYILCRKLTNVLTKEFNEHQTLWRCWFVDISSREPKMFGCYTFFDISIVTY